MTPINVDSWMDIIANLWIGIVVMALAVIPGYMAARKNHRGIQEIKNQVVNGHADSPPLRTDLDRVIAGYAVTSPTKRTVGATRSQNCATRSTASSAAAPADH